jgi:hypothetical protein
MILRVGQKIDRKCLFNISHIILYKMGNKLSPEEKIQRDTEYVLNKIEKSDIFYNLNLKYRLNLHNYYIVLIDNQKYDDAIKIFNMMLLRYGNRGKFELVDSLDDSVTKESCISIVIKLHMYKRLPYEYLCKSVKLIIDHYQHYNYRYRASCVSYNFNESFIQYCKLIEYYDIVDLLLNHKYKYYGKSDVETWVGTDNLYNILKRFREHEPSLIKIKKYIINYWNKYVITNKIGSNILTGSIMHGDITKPEMWLYEMYKFFFIECDLPLEYNDIEFSSGGRNIDNEMQFKQRNMLQKIYKLKINGNDNKSPKDMFIATECVSCMEKPNKLVMTSCGHAVLCELCFELRKEYRKCDYCNRNINVENDAIFHVNLV